MDRLDAMLMFVTAAEAGSLAAAARQHGRSAASVTRAVALLERHTGETLLLRSTRKLSLTPAGERHLEVWREIISMLEQSSGSGAATLLRGRIVLTAPELFGRLHVMPLVESFLGEHPEVSAGVSLANRIVNLIGEGVDAAVRLAPLPDSALTAIKLGQVRTLICASPAYLARRGRPENVQDLASHDCIGLNAEGSAELWPFAQTGGNRARLRSVRVGTRLNVNNAAAAIDGCRRGHGIIAARSYQIADDIASGLLVRLLRDAEIPPTPAHMVFTPDRARSGVVRAFIDHATPVLKRDLAIVEEKLSAQS